MYFEDVRKDDEVYGLLYGKGEVCFVLDKKFRLEGSYMFEVQYKTKKVFYNEDGVPDWCSGNGDCQTVFFADDLEKPEQDFDARYGDLLSKKKIIKLQEKGSLEMRTPNGSWRNVERCPQDLFMKAIKYEDFHLFRKEQ